MSAYLTSEERTALLVDAQAAWLHESSCFVRGTFIDCCGPYEPAVSHRRTKSLPAAVERSAQLPLPSLLTGSVDAALPLTPRRLSLSIGYEAPPLLKSPRSDTDCASTTYSEADRSYSSTACSEADRSSNSPLTRSCVSPFTMWGDCEDCDILDCDTPDSGCGSEAIIKRLDELANLVADECSFMRVEGHKLMSLTPSPVDSQRYGRNGDVAKQLTVATICLFVRGLPWTKRAKWTDPLRRSAVFALERVHLDAAVTGGNLFVDVPGIGRVQVDFAAAR